ncbi:MAG: VanZ family protein, partial [Bacilli bacterium]
FVRKGIGHIGLNFLNGILGFLTFYTFAVTNKKRDYLMLTFVVGLGLAFIFEGLQYFAPGRSPTFVDVVYNFMGYAFAQLLMLSLVSVLDYRHFKVLIKQKRTNNKPAS